MEDNEQELISGRRTCDIIQFEFALVVNTIIGRRDDPQGPIGQHNTAYIDGASTGLLHPQFLSLIGKCSK